MRGPGQRAGLTRATVLVGARELLATGGVAALSMRALARHLDVTPNALYSHVSGKDGLLDDLLDDLLAGVVVPAADVVDPLVGLSQVMTSTWRVLTAAPDLVPLYLVRQGARGDNAVRLGVVMDGLLARVGLRGRAAEQARTVLIVHTIGAAAFATAGGLTSAQARRTFASSLRWLLAGIAAEVAGGPTR